MKNWEFLLAKLVFDGKNKEKANVLARALEFLYLGYYWQSFKYAKENRLPKKFIKDMIKWQARSNTTRKKF